MSALWPVKVPWEAGVLDPLEQGTELLCSARTARAVCLFSSFLRQGGLIVFPWVARNLDQVGLRLTDTCLPCVPPRCLVG